MESLATQPQSRPTALAYLEQAEQLSVDLPELKHVGPVRLEAIGIVGGGTMGCGIAVALLLKGLDVTVLEQDCAQLSTARQTLTSLLKMSVRRGKLQPEQMEELLADKLHFTLSYKALSKADLVIEAVFEDLDVKRAVFAQLDKACRPGAILATNTSYLDVNQIAVMTTRPQNVLGLHFFSPAYIMKLLEIVVGEKTAPKTLATGLLLAEMLGKVSVPSGVCDGFIANRMLATARASANAAVLEGASPYDVDDALVRFGFPMGPFAMSDLAGLDIGWATRKRQSLDGKKNGRDFAFLDRICESGWFGQKTGRGFYVYPEGQIPGQPNDDVIDLISRERWEKGMFPRVIGEREIVTRYLASMINEAAKLLEEGIARRPSDIDLAVVHGYGFPKARGGPLFHADQIGLPLILQQITTFMKEDAQFWAPSALLVELVDKGLTFSDLNQDGERH